MQKDIEISDLLDEYLVGQHSKLLRPKVPRVQAKRILDRLIAQDSSSYVNLTAKKPAAKSVVKSGQSVYSPHIADLRRKAKQKFDQPSRSSWLDFFAAKEKVRISKIEKKGGSLSMSKIYESLRAGESKYIEPVEPLAERSVETEVDIKQNIFATVTIFASLLLVLILPIKAATWGHMAYSVVQSINTNGAQAFERIVSGLTSVEAADYRQAGEEFLLAETSFTAIRDELQGFSDKVGVIMRILPPVQAAEQLTEAGQQLTQAATLLSSIIDEPHENVTDSLYSVLGKVDGAVTVLRQAQKNIELIPQELVPIEYRSDFAQLTEKLPLLTEQLTEMKTMSEVMYQLLGGQQLSRVLFLFQNNREMRPTGGFIGSFALVDFHRGQVSGLEFPGQGSYFLDGGMREKIIPPYALQLLSPVWYMRDANWWSDFPTSARKVSSMYVRSGGPTVDAVIAVNSDVLQDLLRVVGPIELTEYNTILNSQNVYDVLQSEVELNYDKTTNEPKKILVDALPLLLTKIFEHTERLELVELFAQALSRRDIQLYTQNDETQKQIASLHWDGSQKSTDRDYLQVVSTNLGGGKTDSSIEEIITHRAEIKANGTIDVTVTMEKIHTPTANDVFAALNNVDYLRFYVPEGSTLLAAGGFQQPGPALFATSSAAYARDNDLEMISGIAKIDDTSGTRMYDELGKTVFGNWMQVKPNSKSTVYISYRLPFRLQLTDGGGTRWLNVFSDNYQEVDNYSLLLQRQSGKKKTKVESTLIFDPSFKVVWSKATDDEALSVADRLVTFASYLDRDHYYTLLLTKDKASD